MRNAHMTTGFFDHHARRSGGHPKIGGVLAGDHVNARRKIDGAAFEIIVRARLRAFAAVIDPVDRHPGDPLIPR
jgi:hypothetical protein